MKACRYLWTALALALLCALCSPALRAEGLPRFQASLGKAQVELEMAMSDRDRYQGLSGRASLPPQGGMAFVYPRPGNWGMVMRGMRFSLDFVWINQGRVVGLTPEVPPPAPGQAPREANPPQQVDTVLELPAGFIARHGLKIGDRLVWRNIR